MVCGIVDNDPVGIGFACRAAGLLYGADMRPEAGVALSGRPHPLVHLMEYECVVREGLDHTRTVQGAFPFHSDRRIPKVFA